MRPVALAIFVNTSGQMPAQAERIAESLIRARNKYQIPIYGFCEEKCSACTFDIMQKVTTYSQPLQKYIAIAPQFST